MSLIKLPDIRADFGTITALEAPIEHLEKWDASIVAKADTDNTISIYEGIGESWDGTGVTANRIAAALRAIGPRDVVVNINSPGGNYFEGVTIYNLLKNHPYKVTVNVLGLAASAASIIAMAGDEILMGDAANLMIHNAMGVVYGNKEDMQSVIDLLHRLDSDMADVYVARTGLNKSFIQSLMSAETWLNGESAIEQGFATGELHDATGTQAESTKDIKNTTYLRFIENSLKKEGKTKSQRREIMSQIFSSKSGAASSQPVKSSADNSELIASLQSLITSLKG
ncbi:head maturation protease, ClpP-related [Pelistega ratti]|uniref:head maturation protease, ClpP-related n=1 Tax=Pelistega ratti TaxID=2652177 RepID=UPI0013598FF4|nr:head maturation protease, ClpP-related [Pelistega ratti]